MELGVELDVARRCRPSGDPAPRTRVDGIEAFGGLAQGRPADAPLRREPDGEAFEGSADLDGLEDLPLGEGPYGEAARRDGLQQALLLQPDEGQAQGRARDAEALDHLQLGDALAGAQLAAQHEFAQGELRLDGLGDRALVPLVVRRGHGALPSRECHAALSDVSMVMLPPAMRETQVHSFSFSCLLVVAEEHVPMVDDAVGLEDRQGAEAALAAPAIGDHRDTRRLEGLQHGLVVRHLDLPAEAGDLHRERLRSRSGRCCRRSRTASRRQGRPLAAPGRLAASSRPIGPQT